MDESIIPLAKLNNGIIKHDLSPKKNHLISVFTSLEVTLTDKKRKYFDKIQALLTAWEQIVNFVSESSAESPQPAFDFLFINTLRFVLRADWPRSSVATQTHLSVTLQRFGSVLAKSENYHSILEQCRILESVVKNPWGHSVLCKILNSQEVDLNDCVDYFNFENGKVIVVRLEMLLQSKCEDIAVHLSKACLHTYNSFNEDLEGFDTLDFNQDEIDYITDIYFSSLLKTKKKSELIAEIKKYQLDDGLRLLQRYRQHGVGTKYNENCRNARVWKCNKKLIDLLSSSLLANAVLNESLLDSQSQLEDLILEWAAVQTINDILPPMALEMIRKFVLIASSSKCIYPFCSFLIRNGSCKNHDINQVARCLIRAINQNMNEIEQYRVSQERDKLKEIYNQLSKGFLLVSELFAGFKNIYKECLLTSFSLTPSRESLQTMEEFIAKLTNAVETNESDNQIERPSEVQPSPTEAPVKTHDTSELNEIFESMGVAENEVSVKEIDSSNIIKPVDFMKCSSSASAPAFISEIEELQIEDSLRVDMNCILRYPRYHTLNWDLEWNELKKNCEQYLEDFEKKGFDDIELKYLILDYNQFKDQPSMYDDCGIEKGYEQFALSPVDSEEEYSNKRSGLSSFDSDDDIIVGAKKRKKAVSSDGEESKTKRKRGRKAKTRDSDDPKSSRKSSAKKKKDLTDSDEHQSILDSINQESNSNSLKELRQFRIAGLKPLNNGQLDGKSYIDDNHNESVGNNAESINLELNSILEDSFKELESVDIPPLSPRFNVYEEILNNTLVPSDSEIRLPKRENLVNTKTICINQTIHSIENITILPQEPEKKPKTATNRERKPAPRKRPPKVPGESKPRARPPRPKLPKELTKNGANSNSHHTLLGNDQLFRKIYGTKPKNGNVLDSTDKIIEEVATNNSSSYLKDCVVQLPKLKDSFGHVNAAKNVLAMKPVAHSFTSACPNNTFLPASRKVDSNEMLNEYTSNFLKIQTSQQCQTSQPYGQVGTSNTTGTPQVNTAEEKACDNLKEIDDIESILRQIVGCEKSESPYPATYQNTNSIGAKGTAQQGVAGNGELNQMLIDFMNDGSPDHSASRMYDNSVVNQSPPKSKLPVVFNVPRSLPVINKLANNAVSISNTQRPTTTTAATTTTNNLYNVTVTKTTPAKGNDVNRVHELLGQYKEWLDRYPHLKNIPAPRKRTAPANPSSKRKPRAKNNTQALSVEETLKNEPFLSVTTSANNYTQPNTYSNPRNDSKSKLPPSYAAPANSSSQVTKPSPLQIQLTSPVAFQRTTGTQTNRNTRPGNNTYLSKSDKQTSNQTTYGGVNQTLNNNDARYYVSPTKPNDAANGTLKSLLMQGSSVSQSLGSLDSTPYSHVVSSPTSTQIHLQMPVASNETRSDFNTVPRTYGQSNNHAQFQNTSNIPFNTMQPYSASGNGYQVPDNANVQGSVIKLNGLNGMNQQLNAYNAYPVASTSAGTVMANGNGVTQVSYTDTLTNPDLFANVQVRIPRIDIKKPNFYIDEQSKYTNLGVDNNTQSLQGNNPVTVNTTPSNASQVVSQTFDSNNFNQFQPTVALPDIRESLKSDLKMPVLYATVSNTNAGEISNSNEVCISIPESAYPEEYLESYLTFIQST